MDCETLDSVIPAVRISVNSRDVVDSVNSKWKIASFKGHREKTFHLSKRVLASRFAIIDMREPLKRNIKILPTRVRTIKSNDNRSKTAYKTKTNGVRRKRTMHGPHVGFASLDRMALCRIAIWR